MNTSTVTQAGVQPRPWSDAAVAHLLDETSCPVCEAASVVERRCPNCGADFHSAIGAELWSASVAAATALKARHEVLERVPRRSSTAASADPLPTPASPRPSAPTDVGIPGTVTHGSSATLQSVLAVAGAGLFAVAAIVFTFFNPDLTDQALRSAVVGIITILFLGGAWLLARRRLQFSAEAVGGLGMVFVALDVYAVSELTPGGLSPWVLAAIATLVSGAVMVAAGSAARIRSWLWLSLLGLAVVPAMLGWAGGTILAAALGHLFATSAAVALMDLTRVVARRFDGRLEAERIALTVLQILAVTTFVSQLPVIEAALPTTYWLTISGMLAGLAVVASVATRHLARGFWSFVAGAATVAAVAVLPFALDLGIRGGGEWYFAIVPATASTALVIFGALVRTGRTVTRGPFLAGIFTAAGVIASAPTLLAVLIGAVTVLGSTGSPVLLDASIAPWVIAVVTGVTVTALGLAAFAALSVRRNTASGATAAAARTSAWLAVLAVLTFVCIPSFASAAQVAIAIGFALATGAALGFHSRPFARGSARLLPLIVGAHLAVLLAGAISWTDERIVVGAGIAIVVAIAAVARTVPQRVRFLHVATGYSYALVIFATWLDQLGVGTIALLCLTTSLASIGAIVATFLPRLTPRSWYAVLIVTSVPFIIGIVQVVFERSGWTALSTGIIFLLALTLLVTRRTGLGVVVRSTAAAILVPSLAVVVVCLGAQLLVDSASPVTLPVIAVIVALVLPSTAVIRSALPIRGISERDAGVARIAIEGSALLTGAIAVLLALVRVAAGLPTTFLVLVILGIGAATTAIWAKRRYGWWVSAACLTGALWTVWAQAGIDALEAYLLPPALAAAVIGAMLTARGIRAVPLYSTGLALAVMPILVALAVSGTGATAGVAWRGYGLVAAAWLLLGVGVILARGRSDRATRLHALVVPTLFIAVAAGAAGAVQGVRFGVGVDSISTAGVPIVMLCLALGIAGALPATGAARVLGSSSRTGSESARGRWLNGRWLHGRWLNGRWLYAPASLYVVVGTWTTIERDWFTIWAMWSLMLAYLVAMVVVARRLRTGPTGLPPVWLLFGIAFATAIVAWSPRELRVEWFSLPLGAFLLTAGAIFLRHPSKAATHHRSQRQIESWPAASRGSWALLGPGLGVMFLASTLATFTDPQTWRAILVIVIALIAILVGSSAKLAAPFLLGIVVLPVENVLVFVVQIGRGIESVPWWITLAVVGAVLLIIAVTYERRAGGDNSITARLRDLS